MHLPFLPPSTGCNPSLAIAGFLWNEADGPCETEEFPLEIRKSAMGREQAIDGLDAGQGDPAGRRMAGDSAMRPG